MKRLFFILSILISLFFIGCDNQNTGVYNINEKKPEQIIDMAEMPDEQPLEAPINFALKNRGRQEAYTMIWMSDTQYYSKKYSEIFKSMTNWIAENRTKMNIQYIIHTGDIVDSYDTDKQWLNANQALDPIVGIVPVITLAGNHDINGGEKDYKNYSEFVQRFNFKSDDTLGGYYLEGEGRYDIINIQGERYLFLSVGYGVDQNTTDWMNNVLKEYQSLTAIICTHSYIDPSGTLTSDGEILFDNVIEPNKNVKLVLCGHKHGVGHFPVGIDDNHDGKEDRIVYQVVGNYQTEPYGGGGYMFIMQFNKLEQKIEFKSYSPYFDDYIYFDGEPDLEEFSVSLEQ